jgi:hypothetical protein
MKIAIGKQRMSVSSRDRASVLSVMVAAEVRLRRLRNGSYADEARFVGGF